jgi:hypothetical protein
MRGHAWVDVAQLDGLREAVLKLIFDEHLSSRACEKLQVRDSLTVSHRLGEPAWNTVGERALPLRIAEFF